METQNNILESKDKKQIDRKISFGFFVAASISLGFFIYEIYRSIQDETGDLLSGALFGTVFFTLSLIFAGISLSFFLKYKFSGKNIIFRNIPIKLSVGIVLLALIFFWQLILLSGPRNSISTFAMSKTEWIIFGIGIILIVLGIFRKKRDVVD